MGTGEPQVRVGYMRMMFDQIDRHDAPGMDAVVADLAATREQVMRSGGLGWLPGAVNLDTIDALTVRLGRPEGERFFQLLWPRVWADAPFLSNFTQGILRMHRDPGSYLKYIQRGFPQVFRNFGDWKLGERGTGVARATLVGAPVGCFHHDAAWMHYTAASLVTLYDQGGHAGEVRLVDLDPVRRAAQFEFRWG